MFLNSYLLLVFAAVAALVLQPSYGEVIDFQDCTASSEYSAAYKCWLAINRETGNCNSAFVTKPKTAGEYWEGNLGRTVNVKTVTIHNRGNTVSYNRLTNFEIKTESGATCASYNQATAFAVKTFDCVATTSKIKIVTNKNEWLELCEVVVDGDYLEAKDPVVPFQSCVASSQYNGNWACGLATDNKTDHCGSYVYSSYYQKVGQYWQGIFATEVDLKEVTIYNRINTLTYNRMGNFKIFTDGDVECASQNSATNFIVKTFACVAKTKTIKIQTNIAKYLEMCEVVARGIEGDIDPIVPFSSCGASSEYNGNWKCGLAMNNKTDHCSSYVYCSYYQKVGEFWEGFFDAPAQVTSVTIFTRANTQTYNRMTKFKIVTDSGEACASYDSATNFLFKTFKCEATTKSIKIITELNKYVELCEVIVRGIAGTPPDTVKFKKCAATSSYNGNWLCEKAMDGEKSECTNTKTFCSYYQKAGQAWTGYFEGPVNVKKVTIYNRANTLTSKRLINFKIKTDTGAACAEYNTGVSFLQKEFDCVATTRSLTVQTEINKWLELCEVVVTGTPAEDTRAPLVAIPCCNASSNWNSYWACDKASDGDTDKCSKTYGIYCSYYQKVGEWWEGNFGQHINVQEVHVFNRGDRHTYNRLTDFQILAADGTACAEHKDPLTFIDRIFKCSVTTSKLRIRTNLAKWLELCEVKVYGTPVVPGSTPNCENPPTPVPEVVPTTGPDNSNITTSGGVTCEVSEDGSSYICRDTRSGKTYQPDEQFVVHYGTFCYHFKCANEPSGVLHPFKVDCEDKHGSCIAPATPGKVFDCEGPGICDCIFHNGYTAWRRTLTYYKCTDGDTMKSYDEGEKWTSYQGGFCNHFECKKTESGELHPYKTECHDENGSCVAATEAGTDFNCSLSTKGCLCKLEDDFTMIYYYTKKK